MQTTRTPPQRRSTTLLSIMLNFLKLSYLQEKISALHRRQPPLRHPPRTSPAHSLRTTPAVCKPAHKSRAPDLRLSWPTAPASLILSQPQP